MIYVKINCESCVELSFFSDSTLDLQRKLTILILFFGYNRAYTFLLNHANHLLAMVISLFMIRIVSHTHL